MDNLGTGGNRGSMDERSPEVFDGKDKKVEDLQSREKQDLSGEAKTELGSMATEMFGTPDFPEIAPPEMTPPEIAPPEMNMLQGPQEAEPLDAEYRPLAEDGSTEGKIDKDKILTFGGDLIDKESQKQVEKALSKYKNDPFELDNIRNEMMADGLRDNYGRIFGNDTGVDDAPEGEQAKIVATPENKQAEVIELSEMAEGKVA